MKKFVSLILILMMMPLAASGAEIYSRETQAEVTKGVTLKNIEKFYGSYSLNISCVTADLSNPDLKLDLLKNGKGIDKKDTVTNLSKTENGVVAAINGDFFSDYKNGQSFSLGIEIKDEKLLQSHIQDTMAAGLWDENALDLTYIKLNATITCENEAVLNVSHINKPTDYYGALLVYTADFNGGISPFFPMGITVVTVENNVVSAKGTSFGGTVPIPQNGYILAIDDVMTPILDINTNIGEKIELNVSMTPDMEGIKTAFGGGTLLLKDGKKTEITHNVAGNNPRSAIGTNEDGTVVYMITVDGRQSKSRGVTLSELGDICLELGCVNAINLDGGGSTNMVGKTVYNQNTHTFNSPSENRKVINALGIVSDAEPQEVAGFKLKTDTNVIFSGEKAIIEAFPYDENFNTPKEFSAQYEWKVTNGKGFVKDNIYHSSGGGESTVSLYVNGIWQADLKYAVLDEIAGFDAYARYKIGLGKSLDTDGMIKVFDASGKTAVVHDIMLLNPEYDKQMLSIKNGKITALKEGVSYLKLSHKNVSHTITFICGDYEADIVSSKINDALNKSEKGGETFNILGGMPMDTFMQRLCYLRATSVLNEADISAVLGGKIESTLTPSSLSPVLTDGYSEKNYKNATVLTIEQKKETLNVNSQWDKIVSAVKSSTKKNLFILLSGELQLKNKLEEDAFMDVVSKSNKNVFVVYNGVKNTVVIKNENVRFISLADGGDYTSVKSTLENIKYLSFNITENGATYEFKSLY
ncbi:MAG: phosphodiester glycosidase family protein [Clostridia bacterium]|nr:phosphodiester glycosidase family protein [Clostridia bacterium]